MPGPVGTFHSGKNSRASVSGAHLTLRTYSVDHQGDDLDTSNFECNGFRQGVIGLEVLHWGLDGDWDSEQNRFDDPPGLYPRDDGDNMSIETVSGGDSFDMPVFRCDSSTVGSNVEQKVTFSSKGLSQGEFSTP